MLGMGPGYMRMRLIRRAQKLAIGRDTGEAVLPRFHAAELAALDILWGLSSHEMYRPYVMECGWTPRRFEMWLDDTSEHLLIENTL